MERLPLNQIQHIIAQLNPAWAIALTFAHANPNDTPSNKRIVLHANRRAGGGSWHSPPYTCPTSEMQARELARLVRSELELGF